VREFLIRTSADHGWPAFHHDRMAEVLQAEGWASEPVDGSGDFCARAEGVDVSYAGEEVGWQVTFDGDMPRAEEWIEQVTRQIAAAAGEPCDWLEIS
jgi:hypothetical protein